jgi:iron-sulfur cluster repair protein YtfE (RIC family)
LPAKSDHFVIEELSIKLEKEQKMSQVTQPLRDEHKELLPHIKQIRTVADSIGTVAVSSLQQSVGEVYEFLTHHLLIHAQAEERVLYPVVGKLMGATEATATMRRDHVEISRLTEELGALLAEVKGEKLSVAQEQALRRVLYGLSVLVIVHFAKEEEVYLPLLDARMTSEEARHLFATMEQAAGEARSVVR